MGVEWVNWGIYTETPGTRISLEEGCSFIINGFDWWFCEEGVWAGESKDSDNAPSITW